MMLVAENRRRMADGSHHRSEHAAMTRTAPWELTKQPNKQAKATKVQRTAADPGRVGNQSSCHQHNKKKYYAHGAGAMTAQKTSSIQAGAKKRELSQIAQRHSKPKDNAPPHVFHALPCPTAEGRVRCDGASISGPSRQRPLPVRHRTFSLVFHARSDYMTCMQIFRSGRWTCMHALYRAVLLCLDVSCFSNRSLNISSTDHYFYYMFLKREKKGSPTKPRTRAARWQCTAASATHARYLS